MGKDYLLVVDDYFGIRRLLCEFLSQEGFLVKEAADGQAALQIVQNTNPRLVFLDLKMPGLSGIETLIKLKQLSPQTLVIVITAYALDKITMEAVKNAHVNYLVYKPFDLKKLQLILHTLLSNPFEASKLRLVQL
ncbi:MAG: response regulator [Bacillota bacterium]|nr:response regulator [Bacillota bacterium]MDP4160795.1 response regulator [Bacillota bacterium]